MAIAAAALNLLTFPQHWDGARLTLRVLCLPQGDPEAPLAAGQPAFADAELAYEARLIPGLDHLPRAADAVAAGPLALHEPPAQKAALFDALRAAFDVEDGAAEPDPAAPPRFRKPVTDSYRALVGDRQLSPGLADAEAYACALHAAHAAQPEAPAALSAKWSWGEALAMALRQPKLATALGLVGEATLAPAGGVFAEGGWLYVGLAPGGPFAAAGLTASFAARIPPLVAGVPRDLFAAALFPLDDPAPADDAFPEAELYDRGFARLVHAAADGDGVRLAWDDEQVADAFARQVAPDTTRPMGVAGYRVDVRDTAGDGAWRPLQQVASLGELAVGAVGIGAWTGEQIVEVAPVQPAPDQPGDFWMPPYFATWRGGSLVLTDPELADLQAGVVDPGYETFRLDRERMFTPVGYRDTPLLYGHTYQFRVRLADLARGGPAAEADTPGDPADRDHHVTTVAFPRHRPPGQVRVLKRPAADAPQIICDRPLLPYPALCYAGVAMATLKAARLAGEAPDLALPDPDVQAIAVRVEVRGLVGDPADWLPLYETSHTFADAGPTTLSLQFHDVAALGDLPAPAAAGPLPLPTARDLRISLTAVGDGTPGYFASEALRRGQPATVEVRAAARVEGALFTGEPTLDALFFRPSGPDVPPARPLERLADLLDFTAGDLTLAAPPGARQVLGAAVSLRHTPAPERASIAIASESELHQRWINVLRFDLARDWTWSGLAPEGVIVSRRVGRAGDAGLPALEEIGRITLPRALGPGMAADVPLDDLAQAPGRASTTIVFLDALDPKPPVGAFPAELTVEYVVSATFADGSAATPLTAEITLPVTTPPSQTPRLVSVGLALSPHEAADDYSSTQPRERRLWFEFDAPPADPQDAFFVRILARAPDPLLTTETPPELAPEPALALDDETVRHIVPGQPRDDSGLRAMRPLDGRADRGAVYLIPLPDGLDADAPELFDLFTYEIRLGHTGERWSTARGRFGPPLRVAGVQHPAPTLACQAARVPQGVLVRAPFATPVLNGRHVRPPEPRTRLWAVLYARVQRADAGAWRNLMLLRAPLRPPGDQHLLAAPVRSGPPRLYGEGGFAQAAVEAALRARGLPADAPLTALAAEFHTAPEIADPLAVNLGQARMLRVSPLVAVPPAC